jgi:hypothetical protein
MKLIDVRKIEDCFDGGSRLEYHFDGGIAEAFMRRLAENSRLDFFPEFPKPFFKIFREDGLQVKGIIGGTDIEAYFPRSQTDAIKAEFEAELHRLLET